MTRLRPANIRQTSGTLCYAYDGISNYYYSDQLKKNLANANALTALGRKLVLPTTPLKRGKLHTLQPASLPMSIQLRTQKTMQLILAHSRNWLLNKTRLFASVLMPPKTSKIFEKMAGLRSKVTDKHVVLEHAMFAVVKNFENLSIASNARHVHMRRKQTLTKLYKQHLKKFYLGKQACGIQKDYHLNKIAGFHHKQKKVKQQFLWNFYCLNEISKHNQLLNSGDYLLNFNTKLSVLKRSLASQNKPYVNFCNRNKVDYIMAYNKIKPLLHPTESLSTKSYFKGHPKQKVMNFAFAYLGAKAYDNKSKCLIGPKLATLHVEKSSYRHSRKKQAHYYDFQFLKQLNKNAQFKFDFVSPLSKLSFTTTKKKAKDPWLMFSSSTLPYLVSQQKQSPIKQKYNDLVDPENAVFKTRDVPQMYHPYNSIDISKAEQKAVNTVDPRFTALGRFNRPLKLGLFAYIVGKFPRAIEQGYRFGSGRKNLRRRKVHKKAKGKSYRTKLNRKHKGATVDCYSNCTDLKLRPFTYDLRYNDALKVGLTRLSTAIRFELTLNLEQVVIPARLRSTLSVRL